MFNAIQGGGGSGGLNLEVSSGNSFTDATLEWDLTQYQVLSGELQTDLTKLDFSNGTIGQECTLEIIQDATGSRTLNIPEVSASNQNVVDGAQIIYNGKVYENISGATLVTDTSQIDNQIDTVKFELKLRFVDGVVPVFALNEGNRDELMVKRLPDNTYLIKHSPNY